MSPTFIRYFEGFSSIGSRCRIINKAKVWFEFICKRKKEIATEGET